MSSNVFVTPRSITTIGRGRIDHNTSLQALLQNFASTVPPVPESVNLEGTIGLRPGMLWYKHGSNAAAGDGRLLVYNGNTFTRSGIAIHAMPSLAAANTATASGLLGRGDLVDIGDDRLYMVNASGTGVIDVGSISPLSNVNASTLQGASLNDIRAEFSANDNATLLSASANDWATYTALQAEYRANDGVTLNLARANDWTTLVTARANDGVTLNLARANDWATLVTAQANDGVTVNLARANDWTTYTTLQAEYRANDGVTLNSALANDGATLASASANDWATYTTLQAEYRANDGVTVNSARANDWATLVTARANDGVTLNLARANDGATLLSARANDWTTYTALQAEYRANDGVTVNLARANDWTTYTTLQAEYLSNDTATLNLARANDWATWSGLNSFATLKANSAAPSFTGNVSIADSIVHTGDLDTYVRFPAVDTVSIATAGTVRLHATPSGNIGVGTITPEERLDVAGNIRFGTQSSRATITYNANTARTYTIPDISSSSFVLTEGNQTINGDKSFTSATVTKTAATVTAGANGDLVTATMGTNDFFRIRVGGALNAGYAEIAVADDGTEPIYVRQYSGTNFETLARSVTLLDGSGNSSFPGNVGVGEASAAAKLHVSGTNKAGGILIEDSSTSAPSPALEIIGKRGDGNISASFAGKVLLAGNRTDAAVGTGKTLGVIEFGGNHTDGALANVLYSASIAGVASSSFSSNAQMSTDLVFYTGSLGRSPDAANITVGDERLRIRANGAIVSNNTVEAASFNATSVSAGGFQGIASDSASLPSFTWTGDFSTGVWRPNSSQIGFTTGGTNRLTISNTAVTTAIPVTVGGNVTLGTQTNKATIAYTTNTARTYTIPDVAASDFVMSEGTQTVNGAKTFSGDLTIADKIVHSGDSDTAIRFPSSDIFTVETAGAERIRISGGSLQLPETGSGLRFIKIGNGRTANGFSYIDLVGDATYTDYGFRLIRGDTGPNTYSSIVHRGTGGLSLIAQDSASIVFSTVGTEKLRITPSGNVGIGATTPQTQLHVYGTGQTSSELTDVGSRGGMLRLSGLGTTANTGGAILFASQQGDAAGSLGYAAIRGLLNSGANNTTGSLAFYTRGSATDTSLSERMSINSTGRLDVKGVAGRVNIYANDADTAPQIVLYGNGNTANAMTTINQFANGQLVIGVDPSNTFANSVIKLQTDGIDRVRVDSEGAFITGLVTGTAVVQSNTDVTAGRILTTLAGPAQAFRQGNILGTVSQSGGIPTGAIVERGTNANGTYVRFADGLQICHVNGLNWGDSTATGTGTMADPFRTTANSWTFPASFVSAPSVTGSIRGDSNGVNRHHLLSFRFVNLTSISLAQAVRITSANTALVPSIDLTAVGAWF